MHFLASFSINFELSDQLWSKIAFFTAFDSNSVETVSVVSLEFPMGDCLIQVWLYAFSSSITTMWHWYYSLYYLGKKWSPTSCPATGAAVSGVWLITRKLISRKFSHNCGYYVTAKKAVVTSTTISYKIREMHDSFKFKCKRATVSQENDKGGKKSAACSRFSKGNSGK